MITIKLPYSTSQDNIDFISSFQRQYSCVVRYCFNRYQENKNEKEIRHLIKENSLNNIEILDSWFVQSAIYDAKALFERNKQNKIVFGGKQNFLQRVLGKITKEEYQENRLFALCSIGEASQKGNRKFKFDIIENNKIIFKPFCKKKIELILPKLKKNYQKQLFQLQINLERKLQPMSIRLDKKFIYLSFEEQKEKIILNRNCYAGIDQNPNYISLSIFKNQERIKSYTWKLNNLTKKSCESSSSNKSKYLHNKLNFELIQISKKISQILKQSHCKFLFLEDLKNINGQRKLGKNFNRLVNNIWKRNRFIGNLEKRCNIFDIKVFKINAAYSSFIGNLVHQLPDPISASIEIARRGYEVIILKNKKFYPELISIENLLNQWKEAKDWSYSTWKELYSLLKNSKLKYRVSFSSEDVFQSFMNKNSYIIYNYLA